MTWLFGVGRLAHHLGLQLQISSLSLRNQDISEFLVRKNGKSSVIREISNIDVMNADPD